MARTIRRPRVPKPFFPPPPRPINQHDDNDGVDATYDKLDYARLDPTYMALATLPPSSSSLSPSPLPLDETEAMLVPLSFIDHLATGAGYNQWNESGLVAACRHANMALQKLAHSQRSHPRVAQYVRTDASTGFPVIRNPRMYTSLAQSISDSWGEGLIQAPWRGFFLQVALQLLSALEFLHDGDGDASIVLAELTPVSVLLGTRADKFGVTLIGLWGASFADGEGVVTEGQHVVYVNSEFHLMLLDWNKMKSLRQRREPPTAKYDLFEWASLVYTIISGKEPIEDGIGDAEVKRMIEENDFPSLDRACLGDVVAKCWRQEYESAGEAKADAVALIRKLGWEICGEMGDELVGLDETIPPWFGDMLPV